MRATLVLALALALAGPARAELYPAPVPGDPRIRTVLYDRDDVVEIVGHVGYTTTVFFESDERVLSIALGDDVWRVAPEDNRVTIKPRTDQDLPYAGSLPEANTNMTVFSDRRVYFFELRTSRERSPENMTYAVRFRYPRRAESNDETQAARRREAGARALHTDVGKVLTDAGPREDRAKGESRDSAGRYWGYSWQGHARLRPLRAFDDGTFIYLRLADRAPLPAVYREEADGKETIANIHIRGSWLVIHGLADKLILRDGRNTGCVFRNSPAFG